MTYSIVNLILKRLQMYKHGVVSITLVFPYIMFENLCNKSNLYTIISFNKRIYYTHYFALSNGKELYE